MEGAAARRRAGGSRREGLYLTPATTGSTRQSRYYYAPSAVGACLDAPFQGPANDRMVCT